MSKYQALIDALNGDDSLFSNVRNGDVRALLADLERAEQDAERYQWLRDKGRYNDFRVTQERPGWLATHSASTLDAAIDAALAQMAGG